MRTSRWGHTHARHTHARHTHARHTLAHHTPARRTRKSPLRAHRVPCTRALRMCSADVPCSHGLLTSAPAPLRVALCAAVAINGQLAAGARPHVRLPLHG
eukprot:7387413-Prymnesium_polylepis.1